MYHNLLYWYIAECLVINRFKSASSNAMNVFMFLAHPWEKSVRSIKSGHFKGLQTTAVVLAPCCSWAAVKSHLYVDPKPFYSVFTPTFSPNIICQTIRAGLVLAPCSRWGNWELAKLFVLTRQDSQQQLRIEFRTLNLSSLFFHLFICCSFNRC